MTSLWSDRAAVRFFELHLGTLLGVLLLVVTMGQGGHAQSPNDWKNDWELAEGFSLEVDTEGYDMPTAIAVVPEPGTGPKDPLYFVTELYGKIKVVTNDRSVLTFAEDFFDLNILEKLPHPAGENGMAGICLDSEHGYVYVTFTYHDERNTLWNNIARFETTPKKFGIKPDSVRFFTDIFKAHPSSQSHQIGPLAVHDGDLYVAVGNAYDAAGSRDLSWTVGKILRMNLDGEPRPGNPFYVADDGTITPSDYVWAYGFRNPFSLVWAGDQLFVGDNGPGVDRFVRVQKGRDYLYDGSDWSLGVNADVVFAPSVSPVQVAYLPADATVFPSLYRSRFYLALSGLSFADPGPGFKGEKSVVMMPYDEQQQRIVGPPKPFLRYVGQGSQLPVGVAFGDGALFVVPLYPLRNGVGGVIRIAHEPTNQHFRLVGQDPTSLMFKHACYSCHSISPDVVLRGPSLDRPSLLARLKKRLRSPSYLATLDELDGMDEEPYRSFRAARREVRATSGMDQLRTWVKYHLREPKFDNPLAQMPRPQMTEKEADVIAAFLIGQERGLVGRIESFVRSRIAVPGLRHVAMAFAVGIGVGLVAALVPYALLKLWRRQRPPRHSRTMS